jgi:glycosyltransferase involved in cell wall biosynthesis
MRITFILPVVNMGGGIRVVSIYAKELVRRGHTVCLISTPRRSPTIANRLKTLLKENGWPFALHSTPSHLDGTGLDHRVLDRWRPVTDADVPDGDVVIATWWETAEWVAALSPSKGTKVYFIQGHEIFPHLPVERSRATYRLPLHKIVIAPWLKEIMSAQYGDQVADVVPNSVDTDQFFAEVRGKQQVPTVGFVYATLRSKGLDITLAAINRLRERIPDLRIISFGTQRPRPELPLPEGAEFFHLPPQDQLPHLYAQCDVWVTAGRTDGLGLPAMEAMACRTPVVATQVIQTGHNGVRVPKDDVPGLVQGIEWVLSRTEDEWMALSKNSRATMTASSWERSAEMFEAALEHACRRADLGEIGGGARQAAQSGAKQRLEAS